MTREEAQDEALRMRAEWQGLAKTIKLDGHYVLTGKQLRMFCDLMANIADSAAQVVERIPIEIITGKPQ